MASSAPPNIVGPAGPAPTLLSDEEEFAKFKKDFSRLYSTPEEEAHRFKVFQDNLVLIREHNERYTRGETTYTLGVNDFADLTNEEFRSRYVMQPGRVG